MVAVTASALWRLWDLLAAETNGEARPPRLLSSPVEGGLRDVGDPCPLGRVCQSTEWVHSLCRADQAGALRPACRPPQGPGPRPSGGCVRGRLGAGGVRVQEQRVKACGHDREVSARGQYAPKERSFAVAVSSYGALLLSGTRARSEAASRPGCRRGWFTRPFSHGQLLTKKDTVSLSRPPHPGAPAGRSAGTRG